MSDTRPGIGPDGKYLDGRPVYEGDRGGLNAVLTTDYPLRRINLDFGASVSWVSMTPEEGLVFAAALKAKAEELLNR